MPYSVVTHSGKAHIDEVMAIAILAAFKGESPSTISRLPPEEIHTVLDSGEPAPDTWVVDCGLIHDPDKRLFDHHHDRNLPSAALLMFRHLFPELLETDLGKYFALISKVDTGGVRSLADIDVVGESRDYWGVTQQMLVKAFEAKPLAVTEVMAHGLGEKILFEEKKRTAEEWITVEGRIVVVDVAGHSVLEYRVPPPRGIVDGLKGIDGDIIDEHQAVAVYGFDKTDPTIRTLYRTDIGHDVLDFTRAQFTQLLFCHQSGFLARFKPSDDAEWKKVVADSLGRLPD